MWSFDDEENKQNAPEENQPENDGGFEAPGGSAPQQNDDFSSRDPYGRGGDFYTNYNGYGTGNTPKKPKKSGFLGALIMCVVVFAATIAIGMMFGGANNGLGGLGNNPTASTTPGTQSTTQGTQATAPGITTGTPTTPSVPGVSYVQWDPAVVEKCLNASVLIYVEGVGSGSGVIYTKDGYILTNYHVVSNNDSKISVTLFSGEVLEGKYIYGDEANDVSVIKIEKNDCVSAEISTAKVTYMMPVMAIGNALGRGFSTTAGVISAPASEVYFSSTYETMTLIQVDAAINNGNSGGGLFNTAGQLIGIVNSKLSGTTSSGATIDNTGYAIPMSTVQKCVNDLNKYGYVTGVARLGVMVQNYIRIGNVNLSANVVTAVTDGGSAALAGIKANDILYKVNGESISSFETLKKMLTAYKVGDTIEVTVLRPSLGTDQVTSYTEYLRACEEIKLTLKFVEFNPNF